MSKEEPDPTTKEEACPITSALEARLKKELNLLDAKLPDDIQSMLNLIGAYEVGNADVKDIFEPILKEYSISINRGPDAKNDIYLKLYAEVIVDLALVITFDKE